MGTFIRRAVLLFCTLLFSTNIAWADDFGPGADGDHPFMRFMSLIRKLELTESQKTYAANILYNSRKDLRAKVDAMLKARQALFDTVHQESFDEAQVRAQSQSVAKTMEDLAVARAKLLTELRQGLTAEQKTIIDQRIRDAREKLGSRIGTVRGMVDYWVDRHQSVESL